MIQTSCHEKWAASAAAGPSIGIVSSDPLQIHRFEHASRLLGHRVLGYPTAELLIHALRRHAFNLLIIDWTIDDLTGPQLLRWLHRCLVPKTLIAVHKSIEVSGVRGWEPPPTADAVLFSHLDVFQISLSLAALLQGHSKHGSPVFNFGRYYFFPESRKVRRGDQWIALTTKEFDLAFLMFRNVGELISRKVIIQALWATSASEFDWSSRSLDTHMCRVRARLRLGENGWLLSAIYGQGYRLDTLPLWMHGDLERQEVA